MDTALHEYLEWLLKAKEVVKNEKNAMTFKNGIKGASKYKWLRKFDIEIDRIQNKIATEKKFNDAIILDRSARKETN